MTKQNFSKTRLLAYFCSGLLCCFIWTEIVHAQTCDPIFAEVDGLVVAQIESAPLVDDWVLSSQWIPPVGHSTPPDPGSEYYVWNGPDLFSSPGSGILTYTINIQNPQLLTYNFRIRNYHGDPDSTEANDVFVSVKDAAGVIVNPSVCLPGDTHFGDEWIKVFSSTAHAWNWASSHECSGSSKHSAKYQLSQGTYTLRLSGRSHGFAMDRFHLYVNGHADAQNPDVAETLAPCDDPPPDPDDPTDDDLEDDSSSGGEDGEGDTSSTPQADSDTDSASLQDATQAIMTTQSCGTVTVPNGKSSKFETMLLFFLLVSLLFSLRRQYRS